MTSENSNKDSQKDNMLSDDQDEARDFMPDVSRSPRNANSPAPGLRQRPLGRAATFAEATPRFARRGSSFASETLSESRRSLKESTDDLLLPRVTNDLHTSLETSNWHSLPLGLALLPAIGGLFFQNGSAFVSDISLLCLAALFLNWAVRLPWDWYLSAQAVVTENELSQANQPSTDVDSEAISDGGRSPERATVNISEQALRAQNELRTHELLALLACFVFPALGAWLLHAIRSQLSRPSESLISDYNLTIFLLASEVRPFSHLIKLVQRRTLFLQRTISAAAAEGKTSQLVPKFADISARLEELEAHVANSVVLSVGTEAGESSQADELITKASMQANSDIRKTLQPEIDALNRAMRRYEKRTMTSAIQVESRLQDLESRVQDAVVLAAATQRNANKQASKYSTILMNWVSAAVVIPAQYLFYILTFPQRVLSMIMEWTKQKLGIASKPSRSSTQKYRTTNKPEQKRRSSKERPKV